MAQRVSFEERCRIEALGREGSWSVAEIAVHVGRSEPTIRREFRRCGGRGFYCGRVRVGGRGPVRLCVRGPPSWWPIPDWLRR